MSQPEAPSINDFEDVMDHAAEGHYLNFNGHAIFWRSGG